MHPVVWLRRLSLPLCIGRIKHIHIPSDLILYIEKLFPESPRERGWILEVSYAIVRKLVGELLSRPIKPAAENRIPNDIDPNSIVRYFFENVFYFGEPPTTARS